MSDEGAPAGFDGGGVRFRLPIYEGPLDLLLHLVKRAELSAQDVTTRIITEQYLEHLNLMEQLNLDVAGEYLVMAATLLLIKSFALLPHPQIDDTDEGDELKRDLVERLLEYQRYREAAAKLGERPLLGRDVFAAPRQAAPAETEASAPYAVSLFDLVGAMAAVLKRLGDRTPRRIELRDIPVAHCIPRILAAIGGSDRIEFIALFDDLADHPLIIATFMALLELIRRGAVNAWQDDRHGPIILGRGERYAEPHPAPDESDAAQEASGGDGIDDDRGGEERGA
jgi:segregation and condensation protein A